MPQPEEHRTSPPTGSDGVRENRWGLRGISSVAVLWSLHTIAQQFVMELDRTAFLRHKMESGFVPWFGWRTVLGIHVAAALIAIGVGTVAIVDGISGTR